MTRQFEVVTKDCTALSDAEIAEMADLCAVATAGYEIGFLSKQREEWVLVSTARHKDQLCGFELATLERIGGTPCLLVGVASFVADESGERAMCEIMRDLYRRAVLAFPDEDVLIGSRVACAAAYRAYAGLEEIIPRPGHRATGEERAWARRLAKRFGADGQLDDRTFVITGGEDCCGLLDYGPSAPAAGTEIYQEFFEVVDRDRGDSLVVFGWAMAEQLSAAALPFTS
jgi:hypothetical protein